MNNNINEVYERLEKFIENGIKEVINDKYPVYDEYNIIVSSEQQFIKIKEKDKLAIYIVVQYGQATVHYGQTVMPFSLVVLSEKNRLKIAQQLLYDYSIKNNMTYNDDKTIYQIIETPTRSSNFQLLFEGYRSILNSSGTFIISETANFYGLIYHTNVLEHLMESNWTFNDELSFEINGNQIIGDKIWKIKFSNDSFDYQFHFYGIKITHLDSSRCVTLLDELNNETIIYTQKEGWIEPIFKKIIINGGEDIKNTDLIDWLFANAKLNNEEEMSKINEEVDFITSALKCDFVPDTQAFYYRKNFTNSINKYGNLGFSIVVFTVSDSFLVDDILKIITKKSDVNKTFKFTIKFLRKHSLTDDFKLISVSADQQIGDMTMLVLTFVD